jgi:glycosyltransferase involved in cell wall biosynthesis
MLLIIATIYVALSVAIVPFFLYLSSVTFFALAGRHPRRAASPSPSSVPAHSPRFLFVIPAHDEEGNIASTVASCKAVAYDPSLFEVLVIADNCADGTARAAGEAGAAVVERIDPDRRSKGHALEYALSNLAALRPGPGFDAVVVIDADTVVDPGILSVFAGAVTSGIDWAQCYYTVSNPDASWRTRLLTYAFSLFNGVWPLGQDRMGLGVGLKGNGMCFGSPGLERQPWRAYGLTEDLEFSWKLRLAGETVRFLPETRVMAEMVSRSGQAATSQRRRWEAGRGALRGQFLGPLLKSTEIRFARKVAYAVELAFPPLTSLLLLLAVASTVHATPWLDPRMATVSRWLLPAHALMALSFACYVLSPVLVMGLPLRYLSCLAYVPAYAAWKFLVAAGAKPTEWVRTRRESPTPPEKR